MTHSPAPGHRPGRNGHLLLAHLAGRRDRASRAEMMRAIGIEPGSAKAKKFPHLLSAMVRDGLVAGAYSSRATTALYWITDAGQIALAKLDAGEIVGAGGVQVVRYFGVAA